MDDFLRIFDLRGGRSGSHQSSVGMDNNQVDEAFDVDYWYSQCGNKRWGSQDFPILGHGTVLVLPADEPGSAFRYVPQGREETAELWLFSSDRLSVGAQMIHWNMSGQWVPVVTVKDDIWRGLAAAARAEVRCATLNGKLFMAYRADNGQNRLHVWDGIDVRRVGIKPTAASTPIIGAKSAGAVTDDRKYKVAWIKKLVSIITYRSELTDFSNIVSLTAQRVSVGQPIPPDEGETDWELYAYSDDDNYGTGYLIATTAVGTTTFSDNAALLNGDAPPEIGLNLVPEAWKYIMVHGNRLLGAGSHAGGLKNRVWFTPPLGTLNIGDDERIVETIAQSNHVDLDENDGGEITGFGGVINGTPIVFKRRRTLRIQPTGLSSNPYQAVPNAISTTVGCIRQETVVMAEDEGGAPCVYWMGTSGIYRYGNKGLEYVSRDIEDVWSDSQHGTISPPHGMFHADKKQIWWWLGDSATTIAGLPDRKIVYHTQLGKSTSEGVRGGWVIHSGQSAAAYCSAAFDSDRVNMTGQLVPYIVSNGPLVFRCDVPGLLDDNGETYRSYIKTKPYAFAGFGNLAEGIEPVMLSRTFLPTAVAATAFNAKLIRDYGAETIDDIVQPTVDLAETKDYTFRQLSSRMAGARVIQLEYGDVGILASNESWWGVEAIAIQRSGENRGVV